MYIYMYMYTCIYMYMFTYCMPLQPEELGAMEELMELWLDDNSISELPHVSYVCSQHAIIMQKCTSAHYITTGVPYFVNDNRDN